MKRLCLGLLLILGWVSGGCDYTAVHRTPEEAALETPTLEEICEQPIEQVVTFSEVFEEVFQPRCISCHGSGGAFAGLSLEDPHQAKARAQRVLFSVQTGSMPRGPGGPLSDTQVELLSQWVAQGALLDHEVEDCHD
jgi:mono/diheme cytochrome c family protein